MKRILYLGRFQPPHKDHLKTIKLAEKRFDSEVLPVVFTYELKGEHLPFYDCPFSFEEIKRMFSALQIEPYKFSFDLENYHKHFYPSNVYKRRRELLSLGTNVITRDYKELPLMKILGLHPLYLPFADNEKIIRSSVIRELIYEGRREEAASYVPYTCRDVFKEIVKRKDFDSIKNLGVRIGAFKFPKPII